MTSGPPFLRVPPFPHHRSAPLAGSECADIPRLADRSRLKAELTAARVGGEFWLPDPDWPAPPSLVIAPTDLTQLASMASLARGAGEENSAIWLLPAGWRVEVPGHCLTGDVNPWSVAAAVPRIWAGKGHELAGVGLLCGVESIHFDANGSPVQQELDDWLDLWILRWSYHSPFSGAVISPIEAIALLAEWRKLIDSNKTIGRVLGIAGWKRPTVDALLWNGSLPYRRDRSAAAGLPSAVWKSRTPARLLAEMQGESPPPAEIEDGLIRGRGLGANCIPPLSIVVDRNGIYFDPSSPSDLEQILETGDIDSTLANRAAKLRRRIIELGISKYGATEVAPTRASQLRRILVVGQVEDDRSILTGGAGQTNLELLERARAMEQDAWLIYRPHPDVEAGHRKGHVSRQDALRFADEVDADTPITTLIAEADELHCVTSLAGFEALLRGKPVTTHGVPFYAGWGLTRDLGPVPSRRTRQRSLDELVAATLILYPRYIDPVTGLPCPVEVLVERIADGEDKVPAPLAGIRKIQGKMRVALRRLQEAVA